MPEEQEEKDDGREIAAAIFDAAAKTAIEIARFVTDPVAKIAIGMGAGLATVVGALIRSVGASGTAEIIADLQARKDEGVIRPGDIARDDSEIKETVEQMYLDGEEDTRP